MVLNVLMVLRVPVLTVLNVQMVLRVPVLTVLTVLNGLKMPRGVRTFSTPWHL
jgi:hypothetical protein